MRMLYYTFLDWAVVVKNSSRPHSSNAIVFVARRLPCIYNDSHVEHEGKHMRGPCWIHVVEFSQIFCFVTLILGLWNTIRAIEIVLVFNVVGCECFRKSIEILLGTAKNPCVLPEALISTMYRVFGP